MVFLDVIPEYDIQIGIRRFRFFLSFYKSVFYVVLVIDPPLTEIFCTNMLYSKPYKMGVSNYQGEPIGIREARQFLNFMMKLKLQL